MLVKSALASGERSTGLLWADIWIWQLACPFHPLGVALDLFHKFGCEADTLALFTFGQSRPESPEAISLIEQSHRFQQDGVGVGVETGFHFLSD
jgi:hypothetical protein